MIIFDGYRTASDTEQTLATAVAHLREKGVTIAIGAVVFAEDAGTQLYTRLKREAAARVGIEYIPHTFSITDPIEKVVAQIQHFNTDSKITGIIIQKPTKRIWQQALDQAKVNTLADKSVDFAQWWTTLTAQIDPIKDVDGLHPSTLAAIADGSWQEQGRVLPATCQAVLNILEMAEALIELPQSLTDAGQNDKVIIVGKSDLLGIPLYSVLRKQGRAVELLTKVKLEERRRSGELLKDAAVVVSATGVAGLITSEMVQEGVVLIDVGEPRPDVARPGMQEKAAFLTPVPGGVGPMTVISLLENAVQLVKNTKK